MINLKKSSLKSQIVTKRFNLIFLFVSFSFLLYSQDRTKLEEERMRIIDKIEFTSGILKKTEKDKFATLDYLHSLQNQINNRNKIINNLNTQINQINQKIDSNQKTLETLIEKRSKIRSKFFDILKVNYIQGLTKNQFLFLLSSSNWENFMDRQRYLKQFNKYTEKRLFEINKQKQEIGLILNQVNNDRNELKILLKDEEENVNKIKTESTKKDEILSKLKKNERKLVITLKKQKKQREKLNRSIEDIIISQLKSIDPNELNNDSYNVSSSFEENQSLLNWPVAGGYISSRYGKHKHPTINGVVTFNNGIDIRTSPNAVVKAIFDGEVVGLMHITGYNWMVIVRHGDYYSVSSKLSNVDISKGDIIKKGEIIGKIGDNGQFHFEIWKQKTKLNPEQWLRNNG